MVLGMPKAQGQVQNLGPAGERVAENVQRLRGAMSYRELSERLDALGRPIPVLGLSRIESKARRVDADDLMALAVALDVSPVRLLLSPERTDDDVPLTPAHAAPWAAAWRWATGEQPLLGRDDELRVDSPRVKAFIAENRPYEHSPLREAAWFLTARVSPPFKATITDETAEMSTKLDLDMPPPPGVEISYEEPHGQR
jgi:transcriptional regulator with XRE-family HTH domain